MWRYFATGPLVVGTVTMLYSSHQQVSLLLASQHSRVPHSPAGYSRTLGLQTQSSMSHVTHRPQGKQLHCLAVLACHCAVLCYAGGHAA